MMLLTLQVFDQGRGYPEPRLLTPKGEDITACVVRVTPNPIGPGDIATVDLEVMYPTDTQHVDPVVDKLVHEIEANVRKHLKEMKYPHYRRYTK